MKKGTQSELDAECNFSDLPPEQIEAACALDSTARPTDVWRRSPHENRVLLAGGTRTSQPCDSLSIDRNVRLIVGQNCLFNIFGDYINRTLFLLCYIFFG